MQMAEFVNAADLPLPANEDAVAYARRVAMIGAHLGAAWAMTHQPNVIHRVEPEVKSTPVDEPVEDEVHSVNDEKRPAHLAE